METRNEVLESDIREEEDLNVSNLLVTKSERAPETDAPKAQNQNVRPILAGHGPEVIRRIALGALGSLAVGILVVLGCELLLRARGRSTIGMERM